MAKLQAPTAPKTPSARQLRHARVTGTIHPLLPPKIFRPDAAVTDSFLSNKRDKRLIKHSSFVSRIASASSRVTKPKRRRAGNKLKTSLEGLADALPELQAGEGGEAVLEGRVRHKSLKSKKGALKRKERVVKGEMERFGVSMARLAGMTAQTPAVRQMARDDDDGDGDDEMDERQGQPAAIQQQAALQQPAATANRWAALRGYISSTMEQSPAFVGKM
ncbi:hypothetical protein TOPH_05362 [Tolypocladium ophioglossoides CBS 100239]|uniref:Ribosome biogenesis protein SLX9 n=1 Tax=Tolypocladium ophioglossoides (strain CBS 100239) TaxID=1163406 RepID=A0A0L0N7B2_TOLOC|nr:hypothetical protein TOPH_05362 [Tolypocladium ophioglossoides CBS 100239]